MFVSVCAPDYEHCVAAQNPLLPRSTTAGLSYASWKSEKSVMRLLEIVASDLLKY